MKVKPTEIPIESIIIRQDPEQLSDAVAKLCEEGDRSMPPQKRVLVVPNYSSNDADLILCFCRALNKYGYHVTLFANELPSDRTRQGLERSCKCKPWDLIITFGSGCLIASRVTNADRMFINPDWEAWRKMPLILDSNELRTVRKMGQISYIKIPDDKMTEAWFTTDMIDTDMAKEHSKRFHFTTYIPCMNLESKERMDTLAKHIHKFTTLLED